MLLERKDGAGKKKKGRIVIGYDLGDTHAQISYYFLHRDAQRADDMSGGEDSRKDALQKEASKKDSSRRGAPDGDVETLAVVAGTEQYNIPAVLCRKKEVKQWLFGREAVKFAEEGECFLIKNLVSLARAGEWGLIGFNYAVRDETIEYTENNPGGNDHLTYMKMTTVEELPPYAFQSCENLLEVAIGASMKTIGELPFRDCKALKNIDTTGNERYQFNNMLLFDTNNPEYAGNVIVQCLEGIGRNDRNGYGATNMNSSTNPELKDVVAISPQAFAFCENLTNVDLSDTTVRQIPEKCFQNCTNLGQITLPESAIQVDDNAFAGVNRLCTVTIPNPSCVLSDTA